MDFQCFAWSKAAAKLSWVSLSSDVFWSCFAVLFLAGLKAEAAELWLYNLPTLSSICWIFNISWAWLASYESLRFSNFKSTVCPLSLSVVNIEDYKPFRSLSESKLSFLFVPLLFSLRHSQSRFDFAFELSKICQNEILLKQNSHWE